MKAILLHHAGGDKYSFRNLQDGLLPEIQSFAVEVPGRGDRFGEPLLNDIHEMTEDIFLQIKNELSEDYFFVGVSMGTLIAYLLCYKIKENKLPMPKHLFLASRLSPDSYFHEPSIMNTGSEEFWNVVIQYNGVPDALMKHQELRELYEPILRSDFEALEKYNISHTPKEKLNIPANIILGKDDGSNITMNTAQQWIHHFNSKTSFAEFEGGHFFVYENNDVANYIKSTLLL